MSLLSIFSTPLVSAVYHTLVLDNKCVELNRKEGGKLVCNSPPFHYLQSR